MEEIKENEFVRTKTGIIRKVSTVNSVKYTKWSARARGKSKLAGTERILINGKYELEDIVKHSFNIIEFIEDEDFVILEYKSPKYRERIKRIFEVSKIDEYISFKNVHCGFNCKVGDKKIIDNICKNVKIKSIVTHEQFQSVECRLEE